jgi:uncharacterized membrane protein
MFEKLRKPLRAAGAVFFVLSPFLTHFILIDHVEKFGAATAALLLCQGLLISGLIGARLGWPFRLPMIAAVMTGSVVLSLLHLRGGLVLSSAVPHALIYLGLLSIFGLSLLPGREPVVTYFARSIHGRISRDIEEYTRRVTWIWCWFCALQLAGSALLLMLAPIVWWSTFVNILNVPLIAAMMLGERLTRPLWVANPPREYLSDVLRMPQLLRQSLKKPGAQAL